MWSIGDCFFIAFSIPNLRRLAGRTNDWLDPPAVPPGGLLVSSQDASNVRSGPRSPEVGPFSRKCRTQPMGRT